MALLWDEQAEKVRMFLTDVSGDLLKLMDLLEDPLVNMQGISSQLPCQDEKILIISINSLSKVISPPSFLRFSCLQPV